MNKTFHRFCRSELFPHCRKRREQLFPATFPRCKIKLPGHGRGRGYAGTRNSIVEPQHPNPATRKNVMHGRIIDWVRPRFSRGRDCLKTADIFKMAVKGFGRWQRAKALRRNLQMRLQETSRSACVD